MPAGPFTVMPPPGTVIVGGVLSLTTIVISLEPGFPNTSHALQVSVVEPIGNVDPGPTARTPVGPSGPSHITRTSPRRTRTPGGVSAPVTRRQSVPRE